MSKKNLFGNRSSSSKKSPRWFGAKSPRSSGEKPNNNNETNKKTPRKLGFSRRSNKENSERNSNRESGRNAPPNTPVLGVKRRVIQKLKLDDQGESPFEQIQREDKMLYDCIASLGGERACFVELIDWLHAIFREKAISFLDNKTIISLKETIPELLRPCDILFKVKDELLNKEEVTEKDLEPLISVKTKLGFILKDLPVALKDIFGTVKLPAKAKKQLRELQKVISDLHKEYGSAITNVINSSKEERLVLLTSTPHMKGPHLPYPMKISRENYQLMNSVDKDGNKYKANAAGEHNVTNKRVKVPAGHDESYVQRFVIPKDGKVPTLKDNPKGKTQKGDEREFRIFFKPNFEPDDTRDQIFPAAERVNGFAIRVRGAHAAPSTFVITDEGVRWRDKDGESDVHTDIPIETPEHEKDFVPRNAVQVGLGVQGSAIEDIEILKIYMNQLMNVTSDEEFFKYLEVMLDLDSCIKQLEKETDKSIEALKTCNHMGIISTNEDLQDALPKVADALAYVLTKMDKKDWPKEASLFFDENKVHRNMFLKDWLKSRKPVELYHFIAQFNAALPLFKGQSLQDMLELCEKLPIMRYYFPSVPVNELPKRINSLFELMSDQDYYNWNKSSVYGFYDCSAGNVFLEPFSRDEDNNVKTIVPNDIDHGLGPIHEVYCKDTRQRRRKSKEDQSWVYTTKRSYYVGIQSIVQLVPNAQKTIPKACYESDLKKPVYFTASEFSKCVKHDETCYNRCFDQGTFLPSDVTYRYDAGKDTGVLEKQRLDIRMLFHAGIHLRIFEREENAKPMLKGKEGLTYWQWFEMVFPFASPVYQTLIEKHDGDLMQVLHEVKYSIQSILGENGQSKQFQHSLESRRKMANDHIQGRNASVDDLIHLTHHRTLNYKKYDINMLVKVIEDIGHHFPSLGVLPKMTSEDQDTLEKVLLMAARAGLHHAVRIVLKTYAALFEKSELESLAQEAMSAVIKYRTEADQLNVLSTVDIILKYLSVPNTSAENVKNHVEKGDWTEVYSPILELSKGNKEFKGVTRLILRKLLKAGFDPEARDYKGRSAIDYAVHEGSKEMFCALVDGTNKRDSAQYSSRRRSSSRGERMVVSAWKHLDAVKVVDFIEKHHIPDSTLKRLMQNNRVAGELIKRRIFVKEGADSIPVKSLVDGEIHLPIDFVEHFIDKMSFFIRANNEVIESRIDEKDGTRDVVGIDYNGVKVHVKINSEVPVLELFAQGVMHDLIGFGTSISHCVQFDKKSFETLIKYFNNKGGNKAKVNALKRLAGGDPVRVLISNTVNGISCKKKLNDNQGNMHAKDEAFTEEQLANYMRFTIAMMLMVFRDAKPDNIFEMLESFCLVDAGLNSMPPFRFVKGKKDLVLAFRCLMLAMNEMYENLFEKVMAEFLSVNVDEFWSKHFKLFTELVEKHKDNFGSSPDIPSDLKADWVFQHRTRFIDLQTALVKAVTRMVNDGYSMNLMEVLQRTLANTRHAYREGFRNTDLNEDREGIRNEGTVKARFVKVTETGINKLLSRVAGTMGKTFDFAKSMWVELNEQNPNRKKIQYNPLTASEDFEDSIRSDGELEKIAQDLMGGDTTTFFSLRVKNGSTSFSLNELREKVIKKIDFKNLDEDAQRLILDCLVSDEGKVDFKELDLRYCTALNKKYLKKLLKNCTRLRSLNLYGCSGLNSKGEYIRGGNIKIKNRAVEKLLDIISKNTPYLISLNLGGSSINEVTIKGNDLSSLKYLYLHDCPNLIRVHCESPELKHFSVENNPLLKRIHFTSEVLKVLNLKGCNLPADVMHKLLRYASKLSRFTFEPGEEFSSRELAWFVFQGWQPDVSRLSKDHRVNRHVLRAMIDKDGVLKLGGLPITETDLNDIAALLASPENRQDPLGCKLIDLRGLETHHRAPIRRLTLDMVSGKNGLEGLQCQPKVRPVPNQEPKQSKFEVNSRIINMISTPGGMVAVSSYNGLIRIFNPLEIGLQHIAPTKVLKGHQVPNNTITVYMTYTPSGEFISGGNKDIIKWDLENQGPLNIAQSGSISQLIPYGEKYLLARTMDHMIVKIKQSTLEAVNTYTSPEKSSKEPTGYVMRLPDGQVIYTSVKIQGKIMVMDDRLRTVDSKYESESGNSKIFKISHNNELVVFGQENMVVWDYNQWKQVNLFSRKYDATTVLIRLPNNEYAIVDRVTNDDRQLRVYDDKFNYITTLAKSNLPLAPVLFDCNGNLIYSDSKGTLFCVETLKVELKAENIKTLTSSYQPLVLKNKVYLQLHEKAKSEELLDTLEALFEAKISLIENGSQKGTISLEFENPKQVKEFYRYWYTLKGQQAPEDVVNPQSSINLSGLNVSMEQLIDLAEHSPNLKNIEGLEKLEAFSLDDLVRLVNYCPSLMSIGETDLSFRALMPKIIDVCEQDKMITLNLSKLTSQLHLEAFNQCCELLESVSDLKIEKPYLNDKANGHKSLSEKIVIPEETVIGKETVIPAKAGIYIFTFCSENKEALVSCKRFMGALSTRKDAKPLNITALGDEKKEDMTHLLKVRNGRDAFRRSDSAYSIDFNGTNGIVNGVLH